MLIDDEPAQSRLVTALAAREGWRTVVVNDAETAIATLGTRQGMQLSAIILDQWVPGDAACDLIAELKKRRPALPILMLTTSASPLLAVEAMRAGATDYLIKPVDPGELVARIRSVLRRSEEAGQRDMADYASIVRFEGWQMDRRRRELFAPEGSRVSISEAEFDLLNVFIDMPQRVIGRDTLLEHSRSRLPGRDHSDRSVDVLVSRLRRKLGSVDGGRDLIRTVRGVGYVFTASVDA